MVFIEMIFLKNSRERPSDEGAAMTEVDRPAGETVRNCVAGIDDVDRFVYSLAPIGEFDVDFEGTAVTLDDVVTRSSRLVLRPRVHGADSAVVFMYAADGDDFVPVGAVDLNEGVPPAKIDCYDCVLSLVKEYCNLTSERSKAAARQLLNSKPSRKDLDFFALSKYSPTSPMDATFLDECAQSSRRYWVRVDASAKFLEVIEPLRGRRVCHVIFLRRARSADERAAKPNTPRGASEELPAKPKGKKGSFIYFADEKRPALAKKGMSHPEIAQECAKLWDKLTPEAERKYQALADEDKVRYEKEMDLWRAQCAQKVAGDSRAAKPPPLSMEIVANAMKAVMESDASLRAAAKDGTLTAEMVRMAVAAHLKEADGGARLESEYEALFAALVTSLMAAADYRAHHPPPDPGDSRAANSSPLSGEIVTSAITAVMASDAALLAAAKDGTLTAKMLLTAVAAHLKETDGGARLKSGFGALFAAAATASTEHFANDRAHQAPPEPDEPAAEPPPAPELLTGAAGLLQILDEFRIKNGGVDDPYYAAMRGALEELEIEEREEGS